MTRISRCLRMLAGEPEFWSATSLLLWSKWVYWEPVSLVDREPYHILAQAIPPGWLEATGCLIGLLQLAAIASCLSFGRFLGALLAGSFWGTLCYGTWLGNRSAPGAAIYLTLALLNGAAVLRINLDSQARHDR